MKRGLVHDNSGNATKEFLYYIREKKFDCGFQDDKNKVSLSFVGIVINLLLIEAANVGLNQDSIRILEANLLQNKFDDVEGLRVIEKYLVDILTNKGSCCISFDKDGCISNSLKGKSLISIDMRSLINNAFPGLYIDLESLVLEPIEIKEQKVLNLLRDRKYNTVKLIKKGKELDRVECEEKLSNDKRVIDIMKEAAFQDIEIKQESGKAVYMNRIVKTKL